MEAGMSVVEQGCGGPGFDSERQYQTSQHHVPRVLELSAAEVTPQQDCS